MASRPRARSYSRQSVSLGTSFRANDDQVHPPLRLGDVILLFCQEKRGFVYSDVSSKIIQSVTVRPVIHPFSTDDPNLPDTFGGCFKVLATNKYKAVKRLADLKEELKGKKKLDPNEREQLRVAERNAQSENLENDVEQERVKGNPVAYGISVQLLHLYTGKYLTVNSTTTSSLESTNLRMELCAENSQDCIFRILPRYKVRSVGDEVLANDQVTFESLETKGQYLHCSRRTLGATGSHLHSTYYELNLSGTESSFTVLPHSHVQDVPLKSETLWAGGVFRLFHREIECYLVADGSFADVDTDGITEDVHLRKRASDRGRLKAPSTSAITYWRIEKQRNPLSGEAMHWGESCRIRHLLTRQYLTIVKSREGVTVSLKKCTKGSEFDSAATFRLRPVIQGEDSIMYGSFARIYHPTTDTWLHAMKGVKHERKGVVTSGGSEGLQWDGADLFKVSAKPEMSYDDAFALIKVEPHLLTQFNFVAGMVPILETYLSERQEGKKGLNRVKASVTEQALLELASFMLDPYARKKDRQKLVRNLKVLELLVQILVAFDPQSSDSKLQRQVCIAAYRVIEVFLQGNSRKNELYLSRFIPFFQKQIGVGLNAESMLIELIRDNIQIVSLYDEEEIRRLISLLLNNSEEKDSRFLDYLGVLCVCEGKASVTTQEFIMNELLIKHGQELFWPTKVAVDTKASGHQGRVVYQDVKTGEWKPLAQIAHKTAMKKKLAFTTPWQWLESQLDLFGKLAKGNNTKVINAITKELKYITFEEALAGASDPELHPSIRIKYVNLIVVLFIDVGNNRSVLETLPNTFVYSEIVENPFADHEADATLALTGEVNPHFLHLRDWILDVARANVKLICSEDMRENNLLLAQILGVCELLVKFGYYDSYKDIENVIEPLMSMLDGTTDTNPPRISPEDFKTKRRFMNTPANRAVFAVKVKIMRIFDFFFNYRVYLRLQRFIFSYRCLNDDTAPSSVPKRQRSVKHNPSQAVYVDIEPSEVNDGFGTKPLLSAKRDTAGRDFQVSRGPPEELKELQTVEGRRSVQSKASVVKRHLLEMFSETAFFEDEELNPREQALVKVLLDLSKYDDNDMVVWSVRLLNRYFSSATDIFERAIDAQLLLTRESTNAKRVVNEKVNEARKMIRHELESQSIERLKGEFKQLRRLCFMNEELSLPHPQNQRILLNHGILPEVLDLILHRFEDYKFDNRSDTSVDETHVMIENLFQEVLKFLTAFARGHRVVQEQLFARLDSLLVVPFAVADLASVVKEVFTNYHELCVKAKESHVEQIFRLVVTTKDPNGQAELLQALKAMTITRVDDIDLPVKRNQDFVMKYFSRNKEFFEHILGDEGNEETKRMDLLLSAEKTNPQLMLLLNIVDLLATCCQGRNIFVQSICQTVMSDQELLKILTNEKIDIARKKPFCLYLVWVYLDSDPQTSNPVSSNTLEISNEAMVKFMKLSCQHMIDVREMLSKLPSDQPPKPVVVKYLRYSLLGDQSDVEDTAIRGIDLQPGSLVYLLDSLLPLFRLYYWQLTSLSSEVADLLELIRHVARCLLESVPVLLPYLKDKKEILLLREVVLTVTSSPEVDHYLSIPGQLREFVNNFIEEAVTVKSGPVKQFEATYTEELRLNVAFNNYVQAFEQAYNGPNTIQHQVGVSKLATSNEPYSEFEDSEMKVKGPLYLPLGQPFQNFVSCFVNRERNVPHVFSETKHLIRQIDISFNSLEDLTEVEQTRQDSLVIKCLQVLRAIVYNEIVRVDPEVKEKHPKKYAKMTANVVRVQNAVQEVGGNTVAQIVPLLNHPNDNIVAEVFAFLSVFLHDGHKKVQEGCEFLCHRREGRFLTGIARRLELAVAITKENNTLLQQLTDKEKENTELMRMFRGEYRGLQHRLKTEEEEEDSGDSDTDCEGDGAESKGRETVKGIEMKQMDKQKVQVSDKDTKDVLLYRDPTHVALALKVVEQMCNGQNSMLQNFFRDQPDSIVNVNLVGKVTAFLQQQYTVINQHNIDLIKQVFDTLVELCVGNYYNQTVLFDCQIVDAFNRILQLPASIDCSLVDVMELKAYAIQLLQTVVEETHQNTSKLALDVLKTLDTEAVLDCLVYFHGLRNNQELRATRNDDDCERALLRTYHVLKAFASFEDIPEETKERVVPPQGEDPSDRECKILEAWKYCEERSRSVEVLYENLDGEQILANVHFTYNPGDELPEELIEKVKWSVSRDSAEDKVRDFLDWTEAVKTEIQHRNQLRSHWYTKMFIVYPRVWHWSYMALTLLLNILVLVSWRDPSELTPENAGQFTPITRLVANSSIPSPTVPLVYWWFGSVLLYVLGGIHVLMTLKLILTYFLVNWYNFYVIPSFFYTIRGKEREESYTDVPVFGWKTIYFILLLSCSVLSLVFWGYFYPICLLHIIVNNDILQRVLRSVTKNWKSLLWVLALGLIVLYIYGAIAYASYQNYFDDPESSSHCRTLFQCVISVMRLGLIMGGGLVTNADSAFKDELLVGNFPLYIPRTVLDVSFFIIVTTVGLGVIFGIIVDTFSELRDERYKAEADKRDFCFICNLPSHEFDRRSAGFKHHVQHDHNMWNYIYFSLGLDRIHPNDQNAIELYVYQQIKKNSPRFFPVLRARCLRHEDDKTELQLERLEAKMQKIMDRFENEEKVLAKQKFLEEQEEWEQLQADHTAI